jgi:transposase-like protein
VDIAPQAGKQKGTMRKTRKGSTPKFKEQAVKLLVTSGKTQAALARELGISEVSLGAREKEAFVSPQGKYRMCSNRDATFSLRNR